MAHILVRKMEQMFAYVIPNEREGEEGIVGALTQDGWMPLVFAWDDPRRTQEMKKLAHRIAKENNMRIELVKFKTREHVEWVEPRG